MMKGSVLLLTAAKTVTLLFGGMITFLAYRAYQRTASPALRALSLGIGLVTAGAMLGGLIHQVGGFPLETSVTVQSVFTAVGFAVLSYSLYTGPAPQQTSRPSYRRPGDD